MILARSFKTGIKCPECFLRRVSDAREPISVVIYVLSFGHYATEFTSVRRNPVLKDWAKIISTLRVDLLPPFLRHSLLVRKLVVNALQTLAQMQHRVALAREQRVDVHTRGCRQLFEAAPFEFVSDEHLALIFGKFVERKFQLVKQYTAKIERFRSGMGRWQKIFDPQQVA